MTTHSSVLAWRIPGTGEPGGLLSMGSHERPQFSGTLLKRTRCPDTSSKATLWMKVLYEGALATLFIVRIRELDPLTGKCGVSMPAAVVTPVKQTRIPYQ